MQVTIAKTDDPPSAAKPAAWAGWFRPHRGAPFVKLVEALDYGECWDMLLGLLQEDGRRGGDSVVAPIGTNPNKGASPRQPMGAAARSQ